MQSAIFSKQGALPRSHIYNRLKAYGSEEKSPPHYAVICNFFAAIAAVKNNLYVVSMPHFGGNIHEFKGSFSKARISLQ